MIATCGTAATLGGVLDWQPPPLRRNGGRSAARHRGSPARPRGGGVPLFVTHGDRLDQPAAGMVPRPCAGGPHHHTVVMISYDEFVFHRRCGQFPSTLHCAGCSPSGNGLAFLGCGPPFFVQELP